MKEEADDGDRTHILVCKSSIFTGGHLTLNYICIAAGSLRQLIQEVFFAFIHYVLYLPGR